MNPLVPLLNRWLTEAGDLYTLATRRRIAGMTESAAVARRKAATLMECADQLRAELKALGIDVSQPTTADQTDHAPDLKPDGPQTPATKRNAANSNFEHKAALEHFHDRLAVDLQSHEAVPHDTPPPVSGGVAESSQCPACHQANASSLLALSSIEPEPLQIPTPSEGPIQQGILDPQPQPPLTLEECGKDAEPHLQTKAEGIPNSSPHPHAA